MLAPLVLAAALAQASGPASCPQPSSRFGPPPCAASPVPGCLPGYRRRVDAWGRVTYVCDPAFAEVPPAEPPPPLVSPPPPPPYEGPPPPGPYAPPDLEPTANRRLVGLVVAGGGSTRLATRREDEGQGVGAVALELRAPVGGARLRLGLEIAPFGQVAEAAFKYDFNEGGQLRPFVAVGVGGADVDSAPGWRLEVNGAAGLDLYLTRDLFFTAEVKRRAFTQRGDASRFTALHQTAVLAGIGFFL